MTKGLLILSSIIVIFLMVFPVIITMIISKDKKEKDDFKKIISSVLIVDVIVLVVLLSLWVTPLKNNELKVSDKTTTTVAESSEDELSEAGFTEVTLDEYLELLKSSEKQIILVARPTCYYCQKFTPVLKQVKEEMKLKINYINTDKLTEDDWTKFQDSLDYLKNEEWGTPLILVVEDGKLIDQNSGYTELEKTKEFFKNNGLGE